MRKRLRNTYQCLVGGCTEHALVKVITLDHDGNNLFTLPTFICMCGWEPKLLDSKVVMVKYEHRVDQVALID